MLGKTDDSMQRRAANCYFGSNWSTRRWCCVASMLGMVASRVLKG